MLSREKLEHFPNSLFGSSMGLFGTALALRSGGFGLLSSGVAVLATLVLAVLFMLYINKIRHHRLAVLAEWNHPVRMAFFPAMSISLLLLATVLTPTMHGLANVIWIVAAAVQAILTLATIAVWIGARPFGPAQLSPAWFIPAVGNVIAPLAGVHLGHIEVSWYFFSVGLLFWLVLLTLLFNRLMFHDPMPGKLQPTLVILIAPPAVGFLSWVMLNGGHVDAFARILINIGYFFTLVVMLRVPQLLKLPFALSFWALSFPLAAITTASFRFAALTESGFHHAVGLVLLLLLVLVVGMLVYRTTKAARADRICVPE